MDILTTATVEQLQEDATALAICTHLANFVRSRHMDEFAFYLKAETSTSALMASEDLLNVGRVLNRHWVANRRIADTIVKEDQE
jgi:hypothetical protein